MFGGKVSHLQVTHTGVMVFKAKDKSGKVHEVRFTGALLVPGLKLKLLLVAKLKEKGIHCDFWNNVMVMPDRYTKFPIVQIGNIFGVKQHFA